MPFIASKILKAVDDPTSTTSTLASIVEADPGITAWVMRVSNSAIFGRRRKVTTLAQAIALLGFNELKNLVLGASVRYLYRRFGPIERASWEHAVATGIAARIVAGRVARKDRESAFLAGQLHDVGEVVLLAQVPEQFLSARSRAKTVGPIAVEEAVLGYAHTDVGSLLMQRWNMPTSIEAAAFYHHDLELAETLAAEHMPLLCSVVLADALVERELEQEVEDSESRIMTAMQHLSLAESALEEITSEFRDAFAEERSMIGS